MAGSGGPNTNLHHNKSPPPPCPHLIVFRRSTTTPELLFLKRFLTKRSGRAALSSTRRERSDVLSPKESSAVRTTTPGALGQRCPASVQKTGGALRRRPVVVELESVISGRPCRV